MVFCAFAQKEYVTVYISRGSCFVSSDDPTLKTEYSSSDFGLNKKAGFIYVAKLLNYLSQKNYTVELQSNITENNNDWGMMYLLSRPANGTSGSSVQRAKLNADEEITEIARYNIQGIPVTESDKGLQIIIYSNYTTKTIVIE